MVTVLWLLAFVCTTGGLLWLLRCALDDRDRERARRQQAEYELRALQRTGAIAKLAAALGVMSGDLDGGLE